MAGTHLVTVAPWVGLASDVQVVVLRSLLLRRHVALVLPVLVPQSVGVDGGDQKTRNGDAIS